MIVDFNLILDEADKNNSRINRRMMWSFRWMVAKLQLLDIHLHRHRYTWSNEHEHPTLIRLDRMLASNDWKSNSLDATCRPWHQMRLTTTL